MEGMLFLSELRTQSCLSGLWSMAIVFLIKVLTMIKENRMHLSAPQFQVS